jgi:hypothetical protein
VQLASCLYLQRQLAQPVPFAAFDRRLVLAARAEGLPVITTRRATRREVAKAPRALKRTGVGPSVTGDEAPPESTGRLRSTRTRKRRDE